MATFFRKIKPKPEDCKPALFANVRRTNNNIFLALSHRDRKPIYHASAGSLGLAGSKRDTPTSAELSGRAFAKEIATRGYARCYLRVNGRFDGSVRAAIRGLRIVRSTVFTKLDFIKPLTHNGVRHKKPRRM